MNDNSRVDRHGRVDSPHVSRFERRLLFLQKAAPKQFRDRQNMQRHYADRDGEWGIYDISNDAMLAIMEYEAELIEQRDELHRLRHGLAVAVASDASLPSA